MSPPGRRSARLPGQGTGATDKQPADRRETIGRQRSRYSADELNAWRAAALIGGWWAVPADVRRALGVEVER